MKLLRQQRINKLKIKIAGLEGRVKILCQIVNGNHRSYDRENLLQDNQELCQLKMELEILHEDK